jgi:WD40 repeat protein
VSAESASGACVLGTHLVWQLRLKMSPQLVLIESHRLQSIVAPLASKKIWSETYVLHLANLPRCYAASASAPSNAIALLDKRHLQCLHVYPGHQFATTSLRAVQKLADSAHPMLLSTGVDGTVRSWDDRTGLMALSSRVRTSHCETKTL